MTDSALTPTNAEAKAREMFAELTSNKSPEFFDRLTIPQRNAWVMLAYDFLRTEDANAAVSRQSAEIERLTAEIESCKTTRRMWQDQCAGWALKASEWAVEKDALTAELSRLRTVLGAAIETLDFYSYPWGKADSIPDFYSEMDFGDRAHEALKAIRSAQESRVEEKDTRE